MLTSQENELVDDAVEETITSDSIIRANSIQEIMPEINATVKNEPPSPNNCMLSIYKRNYSKTCQIGHP